MSVESAVTLFNELLELPVVVGAALHGPQLLISTSHRSTSQLKKRAATQTLVLDPGSHRVVASTPLAFGDENVKHTAVSASGLSAVFRSTTKEGGTLVEIWSALGTKLQEVEVNKELHGAVSVDDTFSPPCWNEAGDALLYVAEAPPAPHSFVYVPDFGERFTGKREPTLFLLALAGSPFQLEKSEAPSVYRLTDSTTFPNTRFGQATFLPSDIDTPSTPRVIAVGYKSLGDGRKLGQVYCTNRPASIYELVLSVREHAAEEAIEGVAGAGRGRQWMVGESHRLSPIDRSARSPRVLPGTVGPASLARVVYLSNPCGGPHGSCATLHLLEANRAGFSSRILVETVAQPATLESFPGLYVDQLPQRPFLELPSGMHLVATSIWRSRRVPLLINLEHGSVICIAPWVAPSSDDVLPYLGTRAIDGLSSYVVLGTDGRTRVISTSSGMRSPPEVMVCEVVENRDADWVVVKSPQLSERAAAALAKIDWTCLPLPKFEPSEILLASPIQIDPAAECHTNLPPLITFPHGGPHSTSTTEFSPAIAALVAAGYRVAMINYPGSLGFGQAFVESLPPQLSYLDVNCTLATGHYLNTLSLASRTKGKKLLMGGSHGGFIAAHLSARHPDEYDAVVMRNPVVDLPSMLYASDIPDWTYAEGALSYSFEHPPTSLSPANYAHLHTLSPLTYLDGVQAPPTMLLMGGDDRRVPPDQGRAWYHALKGNGVETEMLWFPGNGHALDSTVETEMVNFAAGLRFIARFTEF